MSELIDPAWEEYLSTGIDPTGGDLEQEEDNDSEEDNEPE